MDITHYEREEWFDEGTRRFGDNLLQWRFVCPVCGHVASAMNYIEAGAPGSAAGFACIGRWIKGARDALAGGDAPGPCNYSGGGLFRLNPVHVHADGGVVEVFDFAEPGQQ